MSALLRLSRSGAGCDFVTELDDFAAVAVASVTPTAWVDGTVSWSALLPTFILESVDLRFDNGAMRAYSCADGTGGGKKGDPGEGKGDEDDSLLMVTVSEGVVSFVSGVITAEVISGIGWKERETIAERLELSW